MARVLVVNVDPTMKSWVSAILTHAGHNVAVARGGREASALLEHGDFDRVVSDIFMAQGTGIELLVEKCAKKRDLGFIDLSGGQLGRFSPFANALRSLGASATLQKGFAPMELLAAVDSIPTDREMQQCGSTLDGCRFARPMPAEEAGPFREGAQGRIASPPLQN